MGLVCEETATDKEQTYEWKIRQRLERQKISLKYWRIISYFKHK